MKYLKLKKFLINDIIDVYNILSNPIVMRHAVSEWSLEKTEKFIQYNINDENDTNWKIQFGGEIIGICGFDKNKFMSKFINNFNKDDFFFYIYLDIPFQGKGLGKRVFIKALDILMNIKLNKVNCIYVSIYKDNIHSINLFLKLGFETIKIVTVNNRKIVILNYYID